MAWTTLTNFSSDHSWVHQEQLLHLAQSIDRDFKKRMAKYHTVLLFHSKIMPTDISTPSSRRMQKNKIKNWE